MIAYKRWLRMEVRHVQGAKDDEKVSPDISDIFLFLYAS